MIGYRFLYPAEEEMNEAASSMKQRQTVWALISSTMFSYALTPFVNILIWVLRLATD